MLNVTNEEIEKVLDFLESKIKTRVDELRAEGKDKGIGFLRFDTETIVQATGLPTHKANYIMAVVLEKIEDLQDKGLAMGDGLVKLRGEIRLKSKVGIA